MNKFLLTILVACQAAFAAPVKQTDLVVKGAVAIGQSAPANSKAALEVYSKTKGVLLPRMTGTQRDAITSPPEASILFNTSTNFLNLFSGLGWHDFVLSDATQTLTGKTLTSPIVTGGTFDVFTLDDQGSTPSSPSAGYYKFYAKSDGKFYKLNSSGVETEIGAGGGGSGGINYIANPDAVSDTTGWTGYDDAGAALVDGTGGTFDSTISRTTNSSEVVRENSLASGSFKFSKSAANRQGEGVCYAFTVDAIDKTGANTQKISFDYWTSTNYVDDDMYVAVYAYGTTPQVITARNADGGYIKAAQSGIVPGHFEAFFEPDNINPTYRVCLHVRTTNANAYNFLFDNFQVGPQKTFPGPMVQDLGTETWTDNQTNATTSVKLSRSGSKIFVTGTTTVTGAFSSTLQVTIPAAYTISSNAGISTGSAARLGEANFRDTSASGNYPGFVLAPSVNTMYFVTMASVTTYGDLSSTAPFTWASGDYVTFTASWEVAGWTAGNILSADAFNSQFPAPTTATSSIKTPGASGQYHSLSNNSISLTPGTWKITTSAKYTNGGSTPTYSYVLVGLYGANGADSSSEPAAISSLSGVTVLSAGATRAYGSGASDSADVIGPAVTIRNTSTITAYVVTYAQMSTASNARVTAYISAERVPDFTVYGNVNKPPTVTTITATGTYTTPAGAKYIEVECAGGGGGGGGGGNVAGIHPGSAGGDTTFGTLITANGGTGGSSSYSTGGSFSVTSPAIDIGSSVGTGGTGFFANNASAAMFGTGGSGGLSCFGGNGTGAANTAGQAAYGYGAGGGGGGFGAVAASMYALSGGGGAGCARARIENPAASYSVTIGAKGNAGAANTNGYAGGDGMAGKCVAKAYY